MRGIAFVLAVAMVGVGLPMSAFAQTPPGLEDIRDQGILYFKKGHSKQAMSRLDQAYKVKGGAQDFLTVFYRARAAYKLLLLELAFEMVHKAEKLASDKKEKRRTKELLDEIDALYGGVTFKAAKGETNAQGRIFFEAKTGIINKEKKKRFKAIRQRFRSTDVKLPTTVYLPYGDYLANKVPFSIVQGEKPPTLEIFLQVVVDETEDSAVWWYVGIGGAVVIAAGVGAFLIQGDEEKTVVYVEPILSSLLGRP